MTNPIADAVLAEKALDWEDDIITSLLESQEATPITTATMQVQVNIEFNGLHFELPSPDASFQD